jgi:hypothetical protein
MVAGRTTEPRTVSVTTTSGAAGITAAAGTFQKGDAGRPISSGSGIPANTTILSVQSGTAATMSANASASGARSATIGAPASDVADGVRYGWRGWSPETETESEAYTVAANNAGTPVDPARILNTTTPIERRTRT